MSKERRKHNESFKAKVGLEAVKGEQTVAQLVLPRKDTRSIPARSKHGRCSKGRIFEVTPDQEIVWEYINPIPGRTVARGMPNTPVSVFRAHRYGPDHPGLQGRELDPARYREWNQQYAGA